MSRAIVVGSEGQDGRILFDRLTNDGWEIVGLGENSVRSSNGMLRAPLEVTDKDRVGSLVQEFQPDAVFYLPAVHQSSQEAVAIDDAGLFQRSIDIHVNGVVNFLDALASRHAGSLFYAASSLVFGEPDSEPQNEDTPFRPTAPYGITKAAGVFACRYYRERHGVHASAGILYNHESPLRSPAFVSQKIVNAAVTIARGSNQKLVLGSLDARVDWGYAPDFVDAMIRIVGLPSPDDFVIATGETHSVREFAELAFAHLGLDWRDHVVEDGLLLTRKDSVRVGDSSRLRERTGWKPTVSFAEMVKILVDASNAR